ncbi:MAG: hypothetical protein RL228_377 [Actinomycetota bacterium]|jgi:hypothetical protein
MKRFEKMINLSGISKDVTADWLETIAAVAAGKPISRSMALELGSTHFGLNESEVVDAFLLSVSRKQKLGSIYPFDCSETFIVSSSEGKSSPYEQFLYLSPWSPARVLDAWSLEAGAKTFEYLAEACLVEFFGPGTASVNFGHPSDIGRPSEFDEAVKWLAKKANIKIGSAFRPPRRKDGGVDIFVWKTFSDGKPGSPLLMVQCTIAKDYINKIGDIDLALWSNWLSSDINPLAALAVPFYISSSFDWDEISTRGILLDRGRLLEMIGDRSVALPGPLESFIKRLKDELRTLVA